MRIQPECIPCSVRWAVETAQRASSDPQVHWRVAVRAARLAASASPDITPVYLARNIYKIVLEETGNPDPDRETRRRLNERALELWPRLVDVMNRFEDWVQAGARLAIAGNVLDLAAISARDQRDPAQELERCLRRPFALEQLDELRGHLDTAGKVLYIGDNAGEIVFDKVFIARMAQEGKQVTFAVRGAPIINDVTIDDAEQVGMGEVAQVISTGFDGPGAELELCSPEFRQTFEEADLVIAKGQANFESLSGMAGPIFLLLQAKCTAIARHLGVDVGGLIAVKAEAIRRE